MNFDELQKKKLIEKYQVPPGEVKAILEAAKSDLKTAHNLLNTDICWAFNDAIKFATDFIEEIISSIY